MLMKLTPGVSDGGKNVTLLIQDGTGLYVGWSLEKNYQKILLVDSIKIGLCLLYAHIFHRRH
jgi:hypothetical protein